MSDLLLRILLTTYLAIWSPVLCCCSVKAAISEVTGTEFARCGEAIALARVESVSTNEGGCCMQRSRVVVKSADACVERSLPIEQQTPCRCHEVLESKVRLDTGAKVAVPALTHVQTLPAVAAFPTSAAIFLPATSLLHSTCDGWPAVCGISPVRMTLHAQRTLLLI